MNSETTGSEARQPGLLSPIGFTLLFAVFAVMHFQSLTGLSLTADDDHAVFRLDPAVWVQQGRWGAYLVERFILPLPVITFVPYALFGGCLCISFALIATTVGVSIVSWTVLLAFALFVGAPAVAVHHGILGQYRGDRHWLSVRLRFGVRILQGVRRSAFAPAAPRLGCAIGPTLVPGNEPLSGASYRGLAPVLPPFSWCDLPEPR